jgi:kynurenine formamidase
MEDIKTGFTTRGVLFDIPALKGVPYLEPGTPVYPEDLEAWEKKAGFKVQPGDAIFLRTGRWERRAKIGPWDLIPSKPIDAAGEAGYHISTVPWMRKRDVAIIAADVSNDVRPSGVPQEVLSRVRSMPVHSATIVSMGAYIIDAVDLEELARVAAKEKRWEFMVTGAGMAAKGGTGSPLNLTAIF